MGTRSKLPICVAEYKGHTHGGTSSWIWFFNKEPPPSMTSRHKWVRVLGVPGMVKIMGFLLEYNIPVIVTLTAESN